MPIITLTLLSIVFLGFFSTRGLAEDPIPEKIHDEAAGEYLVLLHGLGRRATSMKLMEGYCRKQGYNTICISYPSRSKTIPDLADHVASELSRLCPDSEQPIHFITHSLGGILVRKIIADNPDRRYGQVVMLAPPNQGSQIPDTFKDWKLYRWITGPAGLQLGTDTDSIPRQLGPAEFPVGVVAGRRSLNPFYSFFIDGEDDGKVSVKQTELEGMDDFLVVNSSHTWIMNRRRVMEQSIHFIRNGCFAR
jgi:pimeloyl-ACP methyl ester carboxylesterase